MEQKQIRCGSVYDQIPLLSANHPWLVAQNLDAEVETQVQVFYNVHDPLRHYRCRIPELLGKRIRGCFFGWVLLSNHPRNDRWSLWNPVTSKFIILPHLIFEKPDSDDADDEYVRSICLSSPPEDPNSILLMTRNGKPNFVFCRLYPKRKKIRWAEMSYAKMLKQAGLEGFLHRLTCCNGKVYAFGTKSRYVVEISIVVKAKEVAIKLLPLLTAPCPNVYDCDISLNHLGGSCTDLFYILIGLHRVTEAISCVYLFKLNMNSMTWEEIEDSKDATFSLFLDDDLCAKFYSPENDSEYGGYIHIIDYNEKVAFSYHVKDKTLSLSSKPCQVETSHVSVWAMLDCKRSLEGDDKQEDETDKIVLSKVKGDDVEFKDMADESYLLNLPFDVLEMIMAFSVGVEYLNFRASCKRCHLAAPLTKWSKQTASKWLQLQAYSPVSPWLMVFDKHTITFIDPMFGDKYFMKTPRELKLLSELKVYCSKYGWLLIRRKFDGPLFFFNPFTSDTRELPLYPNTESYCFSAPPTSPDCIVVGFSPDYGYVHIHLVGRESSWCRYGLSSGDDEPYSYRIPVFCGQDVYALRNEEGLDVFKDVSDGEFTWEIFRGEAPLSSCTSFAHRFLVKCDHEDKCDQHLMLVVVGEFGESVEVFIPSENEDKWDKIDDIGKHAIFICHKTSICIEAKLPEMENKIYFPRLHSGKIVFYSLETCRFHTFNSKNIHESFGDFFGTMSHLPYSVWIDPSWS